MQNQLATRNLGLKDGSLDRNSINIESPSPVKSIFDSNGKGLSSSGLKDQFNTFKRNAEMPSVIKIGRTDMINPSQTSG